MSLRLPACATHLFRTGCVVFGLRAQRRSLPTNHSAPGTGGRDAEMLGSAMTRVHIATTVTAALISYLLPYWFGPPAPAMMTHVKALTSPYPGSRVERWPVPQEKVGWSVEWPEYQPVEYTAPSVLARPPWADPPQSSDGFCPQYNALDGQVQRTSYERTYEVSDGGPRNPTGRTGIIGRGLLGRWGPNHAADPIITRWKRDAAGEKVLHPDTGKPVLQFVSIQRKDCGQWAIPGIYRGYVDDPRNTDNAWMETQAVNYHDDTGHILDKLALEAGDDAGKVQWVDVSGSRSLYANHAHFLQIAAEKRDAHW
ncbi:ADP-ribose pyrophosphatase, mitochondrial isoform X3 [Anomaloglossus baeobatrachus]|uniref:ADP-ribose pyrophosphatase, mitochondrial isoform X3 n=1 Tax=Anomaloglossus baeobatrachus TaxID=238106 RepID=UPI003F501C60